MVPDPPVKKNVSPTIPLPKSLTINNARLAISSTVDIRPDGFAFHSINVLVKEDRTLIRTTHLLICIWILPHK